MDNLKNNARELRQNMTPQERIFWNNDIDNNINGVCEEIIKLLME